jgi:hypothetical protein
MGRLLRSAVLVVAAFAVWIGLGVSSNAATPSGTFTVCNAPGNPAPSVIFTYTLAAPGGDGGTLVQNVAVGACSAKIFYPVGTPLLVTETVPTGYAVTSIKLAEGSQSTLGQVVLSVGQAMVTIGTGDAVLTYTTKAPGVPTRTCVVPRVVGFTLSSARKLITHAGCRVGSVTFVYSSRIPKGGVVASRPKGGSQVAHGTKVRLSVSRGPRR